MELEIRKGTVEDTEQVLQLLRDVRESMEHKEWFYLDPPEMFREMMADGSMELWVAMDENRIAAMFNILTPGLKEYNYGYDLGFSREQLLRVVHMDTVAVHPEYRGLGLQRKLMQLAEASLAGSGERILLCTIHPENRYSLQNAQKRGFVIEKKLAKYGSVRYILRKDIM